MRWRWALLAGGVSLAALLAAAEVIWPASRHRPRNGRGPAFPEVTGANLEGERLTLPCDFAGDANLCLIAFFEPQQADVDTWLQGLGTFSAPGFEIYELPTIFRGTGVFRRWLDGAMRSGIPDRRQRERTITLYLDREAFRRSLGLPTDATIYAILTDREGEILWREEGRFAPEKERSLMAALAARGVGVATGVPQR